MHSARSQSGSPAFWTIVFICVGVAAFLTMPRFLQRRTASRNWCINVMRQIDGAKESWALEHKKSAGYALTRADEDQMFKYVKGGREGSICEQGGRYVIGAVGSRPRCSIPGHTL